MTAVRRMARLGRCEDGQGMVEFALFFPMVLLMIMGIIEFALLINAHQVVQYAAFTASRAYAVYYPDTDEAEKNARYAATIACIAISPALTGMIPGGNTFRSWVESAGLENAFRLVDKGVTSYALTSVDCSAENIGHADCLDDDAEDYFEVKVEVSYWYSLKFPVVSMMAEFVSDNYFMTGQHGSGYQSGDVFGEGDTTQQVINWLAGLIGMKFTQISHSCTMGSEWPYSSS